MVSFTSKSVLSISCVYDLHNTKHACRTQPFTIRIRRNPSASRGAAHLEEVRALVHCADEGDGGLRGGRVAVAQEGHDRGFPPHLIFVFLFAFAGTRRSVGVVEDESAAAEEGV